MKTVQRNYFVLSLLCLVFAAPGLFAYLFYIHPSWLGAAPTNKGILLDPPILLADLNQESNENKVMNAKPIGIENRGLISKVVDVSTGPKWQLVLWSPNACKTRCIKQMDKLVRIRLALGRHLYEVVPRLLLSANAPQPSKDVMNALRDQGVQVQRLSMNARAHLPVLQNRLEIFIANPDNYLVLTYQSTVKPDDVFYDIKQLLKK